MFTPTPCVIFRRYSTDEQGKGQGDTLSTQLEVCRAYAARKGWQISEVLTCDGFSAYKGEHLQPGSELHAFIQRVHSGQVARGTVLLAYKANRLSRLAIDETMMWVHGLTSRGIGIAFADKDTVFKANPSLEEWLSSSLSFALAHKESADKSENVLRAREKMWGKAERREGKWTNLAARPPLWLRRTDAADGWIKDDHRVEIVNMVFKWTADGMGVSLIAQRLNSMGERPWGAWGKEARGSRTWGRTAIRQMIDNPAVEGDYLGESGVHAGKRISGFYPRIVDAHLVSRARASAANRQKFKGARVPGGLSVLFSGLTVCGECGKPAHVSSNEKKGRVYRYLRCERAGDRRACENRDYYRYDLFEEAALDLCIDLAMDQRFFEASSDLRELQNQCAELTKAISEKRDRRQKLIRIFDETDNDAMEVLRGLKAEIDGYESQLAEMEAGIEKASGKVGAEEHLRRVADIRLAAKSDDPKERDHARSKLRQAMSAIVNRVSIEHQDGEKVFTLSLMGGVMGAQFDAKGNLVEAVTEALGRPLWEHIALENRAALEPLICRLSAANAVRRSAAVDTSAFDVGPAREKLLAE